jgi:putative transposase
MRPGAIRHQVIYPPVGRAQKIVFYRALIGGGLRKKSRFTDSQILVILKQAKAGSTVAELCREQGISSAKFYKWRSKLGGMDASLMARMKELEDENRCLKKLYVEAQLSADLLKEALAKNGDVIATTRVSRGVG